MSLRRRLGTVALAALALAAASACKDSADGGGTGKSASGSASAAAPDPGTLCDQLAKACSDTDKHVEKLVGECIQAAPKQAANGCADKTSAAYTCFEQQLCGGTDKVWTLDDFRVLADRKGKCQAERDALRACVGP